jgi:hypothetical protein
MAELNAEASRGRVGHNDSYVDWGAIFAGAVVTLAISFVLLTFGSSVGLSAVSPWTSTARTVTAVTIGAGFWLLLVNIWAFACGGYIAGRMRHPWRDAQKSEVEFRDDAHGLVVWATAVTFAAVIAAVSAVSIGASAARGLGNAAANSAGEISQTAVDTMFRSNQPAPNAPAQDVRAEAVRVLSRSMTDGELNPGDRVWLAQSISARTGLPQQDADRRVTEAINQAKAAADKARKTGILLGFITAATLLVGAAAAWWGAGMGGKHRDEGNVWHGFSRASGSHRISSGFKM